MDIYSKVDKSSYPDRIRQTMPKSALLLGCIKAFFVGGAICVLGEAISELAGSVLQLNETSAATFTSSTLIFLGALLTGLGVYDVIGDFAGAGSIVPITGFANSVVAPAMEFRSEGLILGVGAKLFTIAGPVLVYGITASVVYGVILALLGTV